jgi:hypothetical protein
VGRTVHALREANRQTLHSAREGLSVIRLDDEVQVVAHDHVVAQPETEAIASRT